jgi:hypothetical protein
VADRAQPADDFEVIHGVRHRENQMSRIPRFLGVVLVAVFASSAAAAVGPSAAGAAAPTGKHAFVRAAHFSPDTAGVDVYLTAFSGGTSRLWLSNVGYGDVSAYREFAPGSYAVSMRPHGAVASSPPVLSWTVDLQPGSAYTAAAIGMSSQLHGVVVADTLNRPPAGTGLVRVIQASSGAGHVSVRAVRGPVLTSDTAFGSTTKYVAVPSGQWTVRAQSSTRPTLSSELTVPIASATITSIILLDGRSGSLVLRTVLDAAGAAQMPAGSVPAGGGGTASSPGSSVEAVIGWSALGGAAIVLVAAFRPARRRRTIRA